jgi:hypothetical protein
VAIHTVVMAAVLAIGGLLDWLAASGRLVEAFAQERKTQPVSADGTRPGAATVHCPLRIQVVPVLPGRLVADLTCDDGV